MTRPSSLRLTIGTAVVVGLTYFPLTPGLGADPPTEPGGVGVTASLLGRIAAEDILLRSGAGIAITLPPGMMESAFGSMATAEAGMPPDSTLLERVFSVASSATTWGGADIDRTISPAGQSTAAMTGLRLAAELARTGQATDMGRAYLHMTAAKAQVDWALVNLVTTDGQLLTRNEAGFGPAPPTHGWLLLQALSELSAVTSRAAGPPSADPAFAPWFESGAASIHNMIMGTQPSTIRDSSLAVQALASFARLSVADATAVGEEIAVLIAAMPPPGEAVEQAYLLRAQKNAYVITSDAEYLDLAYATSRDLLAGLDLAHGTMAGIDRLSVWDIAGLIGALGDAVRLGNASAEATAAIDTMVAQLIIESGLMPAIPTASSPYYPEALLDQTPVQLTQADDRRWAFGSSVDYSVEAGRWTVADSVVDIPGALYASSELLALDITPVAGSTSHAPMLDTGTEQEGPPMSTAEATELVLPEDEETRDPRLMLASLLALGMFIAMMAWVVGMLQFMKACEKQR